MYQKSGHKYVLVSYALMHVDVVVVLAYVLFRTAVLESLLRAFEAMGAPLHSVADQSLVWSSVLFWTCAICSVARNWCFQVSSNPLRGALVLELMVVSAVVLVVWQALSQPTSIDPLWLERLSLWQYLLAVITTAGTGHVVADFLSRVRSTLKLVRIA